MKYYEVTCKCGHVGLNKFIPISFFIQAENGREAAAIARYKPRVKHDHKDAILSVIEITEEEYQDGRKKNRNDPYMRCKNIQQQRACLSIYDRILEEPILDRHKREGKRGQERNKRKPGNKGQWKRARGWTQEDCSYAF